MEVGPVREDLKQELTRHLWQRIVGRDDAWERYFQWALAFAQRHVASAYMERTGYWTAASVRDPEAHRRWCSHGWAPIWTRRTTITIQECASPPRRRVR
jgi:hypothetical protein